MLSHFHKELLKGKSGESCNTKGSKLSKCFNVNYTDWIWNENKAKWSILCYLTFWSNFLFKEVWFAGFWCNFLVCVCFLAVYLFILPCWWLDTMGVCFSVMIRLLSNHCWRSRLTTETPTLFLKSSENCQRVLCEFPSKNSAVIIRIHLQWRDCGYWEKFVYLLGEDRPQTGPALVRYYKEIEAFNLLKMLKLTNRKYWK